MLPYSDDTQRLAALLAEIKSRGIQLPAEMSRSGRRLVWPVDENGYFKKLDGTIFNPYKNQDEFVRSEAVFVAILSGRGGGKTGAGAQKAMRKIRQGESGAVLNPDFENLKSSTWPELRNWIPWNLVIPKHAYKQNEGWEPAQPFKIVFKNGAIMRVKGLKDPDSARGPNINWLWYDEAGRDKTGLSWQIAIASVRIGKNPQSWVTTTPQWQAPWIDEFFIQQKIPEDALEIFEKLGEDRPLVEVFRGSIYDNEANLNPAFMASMLASYPSGWLRRQEIFGEIVRPDGSLGDRHWFDGMTLNYLPEMVKRRIRFWDLAGTEKKMVKGKEVNDPDESVGTCMSMMEKNEFIIENQVSAFVEWNGLLRLIRDTAINDGPEVKIFVEQEPASGGKNQVAAIDEYLKTNIPGHPGCTGWKPSQDRVALANIWFAEAAQKKIFIVKDGTWDTDGFFDQLDVFPGGKHDDKITSVTGARLNLSPIQQWKRIPFLHLLSNTNAETKEQITESKSASGRPFLQL